MNSRLYRQRLSGDNVVVLDDFLDFAVCSKLLYEFSRYNWKPSEIATLVPQRQLEQTRVPARNSMTVTAGKWSVRAESILRRIERSLEKQFSIVTSRLEEWQVTRYMKREYYDFHLDCGYWKRDPAGERRRTVLIYLDSPLQGGGTFFRALNLKIPAVAGRIVVWNNLLSNGNCNHAMIHAGLPVIRGIKTILITWERERKYLRK